MVPPPPSRHAPWFPSAESALRRGCLASSPALARGECGGVAEDGCAEAQGGGVALGVGRRSTGGEPRVGRWMAAAAAAPYRRRRGSRVGRRW